MNWQSALGLLALTGLAWLVSEDRRNAPLRVAAAGIGLQIGLALLLLKVEASRDLFANLNHLVILLQESTQAGTSFVFGYLGGGSKPFEVTDPGSSFILAFQALPMVLVVSALSALLFYWRVLPFIIGGISWVLERTLRVGGALGVGTAANVFVGMTESPLLIRPYVAHMTRSELFTLMSCGMATVSGTIMALYAQVIGSVVPDALGHILAASVISVPASITIARIMVPETGEATGHHFSPERGAHSTMDAVTKGTLKGMELFINIVAMLIVLVALVKLANMFLGVFPDFGGEPMTLQRILGWIMAPIVWLMGVPWSEATTAGSLMGLKVVLNEFVAYIEMAKLGKDALSESSRMIMTYAMCGFANLGSLGIMIGGLGALAPERRTEIVMMGMKSVAAGVLATCMTGSVVGLLY